MSGECEARERVEKSKSVLCICAASRLSDKSERGENGQTEIYSLIDSLSLSKSEEHAMTNLLFFFSFCFWEGHGKRMKVTRRDIDVHIDAKRGAGGGEIKPGKRKKMILSFVWFRFLLILGSVFHSISHRSEFPLKPVKRGKQVTGEEERGAGSF